VDLKCVVSQLYKQQLKHYGGDLIFRCNLPVNNLQTLSSKFLNEVIQAWVLCKHNDNIFVSKQVIRNQLDICKNNGDTFNDNWYQKGIRFIEHIYDFRSKQSYDFNHLSTLYAIPQSDFLRYHSLKSSISRNIKL